MENPVMQDAAGNSTLRRSVFPRTEARETRMFKLYSLGNILLNVFLTKSAIIW